MMKLATLALLTIAFLLGRSGAPGQAGSDNSKAQPPGPGAVRARIAFLAGTFATATRIPPGPSMPDGATGQGTSVVTWALDSMFLSIEDQGLNSLFGQYKGRGMLGFDVPTHQYVLSMFNNFGDHPTYHGTFAGDTLVLQTRVPAPRAPFDQKLLWYKEGDVVKLIVLNDSGKGFLPVLEQTATPVSQTTK